MSVNIGSLEFELIAKNGQINEALDETGKRIQGLSDLSVKSGAGMEESFKKAAADIEKTWGQLDTVEKSLSTNAKELSKQYAEVEAKLKAIQSRNNTGVTQEEVYALREQKKALGEALELNRQATAEYERQAEALQKTEARLSKFQQQAENNAGAQNSLRTQMRRVVEELAKMEEAGLRGTEAYIKLQQEAGRLTNAMGDAQMQAKILAHDNAGLQGVISAVSGVAGAFSAAQGVIGLFGAENENLQKIMLRVQSLMSITMGLQQVANTLNKDSYFSVVILSKIRAKYNAELAKSTGALGAATAAQTAENVAAAAGTVANTGLAGAFKMVGAAIKSIPVFGWIAAAIGAIVAVAAKFISKAKEAKKVTEDFQKSVAENAAPAIGAVTELAQGWNKLGDNLKAKEQFLKDNKDKLKQLGVAVDDVTTAEKLFQNNAEAYVKAQMAKARADAYRSLQQDNLKKAIKLQQEIDAMPETLTTANFNTNPRNREDITVDDVTYTQTPNRAREKKEAELKALQDTITEGFTKASEAEKEGLRLLREAGLMTTSTTGGSGGATAADAFKKELEEKKKAYNEFKQWAASSDSIIREAAGQQYAELLKGGENYVDYLKNLRAQLVDAMTGDGTKEQQDQLAAINTAIAEETKGAALAEFKTALQEQIDGANGILEVLSIIQERRKSLEGDNSELANQERETLDDAEGDAVEKQKEQTNALLEQYADYLDKKVQLETKYNADMALLREAYNKAETQEEKDRIQRAMQNRESQYGKESGADYDALLTEFGTFQEKQAQIAKEYDEKRAIARAEAARTGNTALLAEIDKAEQQAISKLAAETLQASEQWSELFGNLDELTASQIQDLVAEIERQFSTLSGVFNPIDLKAVRDKLNEAREVLNQENPFAQMAASLRAIFSDASKDSKTSAKDIKKNWKQLGESTAASFEFVSDAINSCAPLKEAIGDVGATAISSLASTAAVAIAVATAIKTAEKSSVILAIIQAALVVVNAVVSVIQAICGNMDKKLEKSIQAHEQQINRLAAAYSQLSWEIDKALGEEYYRKQGEAIKNLRAQNAELREQARLEKEKKKSDSDKIDDYNEKQQQNLREIQDIIQEITEEVTQTTAADFADQLADGITDLFSTGMSKSQIKETSEKIAQEIMANAVKAAVSKQFLTGPLQAAMKQLQAMMGFDEEGNGSFDGLTPEEQQRFKDRIHAIAEQYAEAMKVYEDLYKEVEGTDTTTLAGAIAGASQESIDLLAGQTNAVRENQVVSIDILREQLIHLASIDSRLGEANEIIRDIYNELRGAPSLDRELRASGYTGD
ncbi:MAG: hypothetical protein IKO35_06030 [Elusimicrobiaceae bacterium]|nr:hypothetical protein [Elusimicrobiaceae bacterium]